MKFVGKIRGFLAGVMGRQKLAEEKYARCPINLASDDGSECW
jgi:hypothetical protein